MGDELKQANENLDKEKQRSSELEAQLKDLTRKKNKLEEEAKNLKQNVNFFSCFLII